MKRITLVLLLISFSISCSDKAESTYLEKETLVVNTKGDTITLNALSDKAKPVYWFFYNPHSCSLCFLQHKKFIIRENKHNKLVIITCFKNFRAFRAFTDANDLKNAYNVLTCKNFPHESLCINTRSKEYISVDTSEQAIHAFFGKN